MSPNSANSVEPETGGFYALEHLARWPPHNDNDIHYQQHI